VNCAFLHLASYHQSGNMDTSGNTDERTAMLDFLEFYQSVPVLRDTNHMSYSNRQKKHEGCNELPKKFKLSKIFSGNEPCQFWTGQIYD
jgi:hypothetical protein